MKAHIRMQATIIASGRIMIQPQLNQGHILALLSLMQDEMGEQKDTPQACIDFTGCVVLRVKED